MDDSFALNQANWNERAALHAASPASQVQLFLASPAHLSEVVRFDLPRLGDIRGLRAMHLQCHIGTDTLSLARLGAQMSGLDFSAASLEQASKLASSCGESIEFVEASVYDAAKALGAHSFDLVYTGIGALNWLPQIDDWARNVAALLKPGGRLFLREAHPLLTATTTHEWNHGLGEIITALLRHGMRLTALEEHTSLPWEALPGQMSLGEDGEWRLDNQPERLPLSYTLQAVKVG